MKIPTNRLQARPAQSLVMLALASAVSWPVGAQAQGLTMTLSPESMRAAPVAASERAPATNRHKSAATPRPPATVTQGPLCQRGITPWDKVIELSPGKSTILHMPGAIAHRTLGNPQVAHAALVPPNGLYLLGMESGSTNMIIQDRNGDCRMIDLTVAVDPSGLQANIRKLIPGAEDVTVTAAANSLLLSGSVDDAQTARRIVDLAEAYRRGTATRGVSGLNAILGADPGMADAGLQRQQPRYDIINQLQVRSPQQVMLEVKIAEVSKSLLDRFGGALSLNRSINGTAVSLVGAFGSGGGGVLDLLRTGSTRITLDGQKEDGLIRVLAEPNLMAISGQQASFISGGKIFIPVTQSSALGTPVMTLEEKNFGISVQFTPTVLSSRRINLKLVSGVSDLSQTGSPFTTINGVTSVLPSLTVRETQTTVQLNDGQSLVIAGLIKNNYTETVRRFPGLGEVPVLGTLFRSSEFQNDRSELLFVITPRLVKPLAEAPVLPTDNHVPPSRGEVYLNGHLESSSGMPPTSPDSL
jgi:pilus assembly protein CpaC